MDTNVSNSAIDHAIKATLADIELPSEEKKSIDDISIPYE
jgi:hypothetical protein